MDRLLDGGTQENATGDGRPHQGREPAQFREFVEMVPEPVVVLRQSGTIVAGNGAFVDLLGQNESTFSDEQITTLFPELTVDAIEANCDAGPGEYLSSRAVHDDAEDIWVEFAFDSHSLGGRTFILGTVHDVTARREHKQMLEQYERIIETIDDGIYTLDEMFTIQTINGAVESMTGYDEEDLVGASAALLADESVIDRASKLSAKLLSGERDAATLTTELETADGAALPVETRFSTYQLEDGRYRQVGVVRDISDRRRFEQTLAALHDSTRKLLEAQTTDAVSDIVVEAATDALDVAGTVIYEFDTTENVLCPTTVSESVPSVAGALPDVESGSGPIWRAFVEGDFVSVDAGEDPLADDASDGGICLSLGEYGVLYVARDADTDDPDPDLIEVLDLLAASAEAALARVDREEALRERDATLREQNSRLRQLEEINAIIRRIDTVLFDADTCAEIEQAVCDQLAASRWFSFAWLGCPSGSELEPRAWAGDSPSYLDDISLTTEGDGGPPAVQTANSETMTVVSSVADGVQCERWRAAALSRDFQSALSVPLRDNDFTYGMLTVYGTETGVFEETLQSVFTELGETIASAIQAVQSRQRLAAATAMELEVSLSIPTSPLGQIADQIGTPVVCEDTVPESGDATRLFFRVQADEDSVPTATVREACAELTCIESLTVIDDEKGGLFGIVVSGETVAEVLLDRGARIVSIEVGNGGEQAAATVQFASGVDVREFVETLDERYRDARLVARRERNISDQTPNEPRTALKDQLTDRQLEVLQTAYVSGFFDWPRKSNGQDLAEMLDVSQPTVSRHLRVGERCLLEFVFGEV